MSELKALLIKDMVEWEARRVAQAVGVEWYDKMEWPEFVRYVGWIGCAKVALLMCKGGVPKRLNIGSHGTGCDFDFEYKLVEDYGHSHELMARGLYCLGFEDESILSQLPELSAHERLELRLNFPREFWPQSWLDEANAI